MAELADSAAIFKIVKSPHVSEKSSDFDNMWYTTADIEPDDSNVTKNYFFFKFKMVDRRSLHTENRFFGRNSSTNCPISAKFCTRKHYALRLNGLSTAWLTAAHPEDKAERQRLSVRIRR